MPLCEGVLLEAPSVVNLRCAEGYRDCGGELPVLVRNCSGQSVFIDRLELADANADASSYQGGVRATYTPERFELRDQDSYTHVIPWWGVGDYVLTLHIAGSDTPMKRSIQIRNPALVDAQEACRACDGEWGARGMLGLVGCNCLTTDAGERCHSSDGCQGLCMFETFDEVVAGGAHDATAPTCSAPGERRWVARGHCSTQEMLFGCHAIIGEVHHHCRHPRMLGRAPHLCVD